MWPMYVDYSDDECKRLLRSLELEAYSAIISAFRAQGCLTKDKRKMLQDLCTTLSISMERHRAEIRRAVNDEHLNTVAERLFGPNTSTEWSIEGRRVVPLMQRLAPQTVFTDIANSAANAQATKNASLPYPGRTGLREISNGMETMASRKRKELPTDAYVSPHKIPAMDCQHFSSGMPSDSSDSQNIETPHAPETPTSDSLTGNEAPLQESTSLSDYISSNIPPMAHVPSLVSPVKSSTKHIMMKSSTITTFSSFDQMTSNLLSSKSVTRSPLQPLGHEGHTTSMADVLKSSEPKNLQRSSSTGAMRTTVIPNTMSSAGSTSSSNDRSSSSSVPSQNKFVNQLRSKPPVQGRQNLPSGLGVKLNIQPQMSQRAMSPKTSSSGKAKPESGAGFLSKKPTTGGFPVTSQSDNPSSQFTLNESLTITKTSSVQKSPVSKTESQTVSSHQQQTSSKVPVTKSLPKASTSSSQYISRSLFGSGTKGAKTLPPVIFNVSTSCASHQTPTKTTGPAQSEAGKSAGSQLLPKSTAIGVSQSHMKLGTSTTQTIQYRNDGGLVRSARIINVTPPAGSRLPCAITPSAISALGLSSNLTSGALRVTLPAGTLNTSSSMRASAVAKPNVIVVHKAQMWPRNQGAAAVIMSSPPIQRLPADSNQENSQKQDKTKPPITTVPVTTKPPIKSLTSTRPQSPIVSPLKAPDSSSIRTSSPSSVPQTDSSAQKESSVPTHKNISLTQGSTAPTNTTSSATTNQKASENSIEAQSRKKPIADILEVSGLLENSNKSSVKEKDPVSRKEKESDVKPLQKITKPSSVTETFVKSIPDSTTSASKPVDNTSKDTVLLPIPEVSKNGQSLIKKQDKAESLMVQSTDSPVTTSSTETLNKLISKKQTEDSKEKNS